MGPAVPAAPPIRSCPPVRSAPSRHAAPPVSPPKLHIHFQPGLPAVHDATAEPAPPVQPRAAVCPGPPVHPGTAFYRRPRQCGVLVHNLKGSDVLAWGGNVRRKQQSIPRCLRGKANANPPGNGDGAEPAAGSARIPPGSAVRGAGAVVSRQVRPGPPPGGGGLQFPEGRRTEKGSPASSARLRRSASWRVSRSRGTRGARAWMSWRRSS